MAVDARTPIPTVVGWIRAQDIQEGDHVFDKNGLPAKVTLVHLYTPIKMWRVEFDDGLYLNVDERAGFPIETCFTRQRQALREHRIRKRPRTRKPYPRLPIYADMSLSALLSVPLVKPEKNIKQFSIGTTKPIVYREEPHPVPPFVMGLYASGNSFHSVHIKPEHVEYAKQRLAEYGYSIKKQPNNSSYKIWPSVPKQLLARYTPMPTSIPAEYFLGTPEQRWDVLKGYMLGRSSAYKKGTDAFNLRAMYRKIPREIQALCESLGVKTKLRNVSGFDNWQLAFKCREKLLPDQEPKPRVARSERRYITAITEIEPMPCAHIKTEAESFAVEEGFIQCR